MISREEIVQMVASALGKLKPEDDIALRFSQGLDETPPVNGWRAWKLNGTASIVIEINGGAQTNELAAECSHPRELVDDISTFGNPLFRCRRCGRESATPFITTED